jgi:hypothetical protein
VDVPTPEAAAGEGPEVPAEGGEDAGDQAQGAVKAEGESHHDHSHHGHEDHHHHHHDDTHHHHHHHHHHEAVTQAHPEPSYEAPVEQSCCESSGDGGCADAGDCGGCSSGD